MGSYIGLISCRVCGILRSRTEKVTVIHSSKMHGMSKVQYLTRFGDSASEQSLEEREASRAALSVLCPYCPCEEGSPEARYSCYSTLLGHLEEGHGVHPGVGVVIRKVRGTKWKLGVTILWGHSKSPGRDLTR